MRVLLTGATGFIGSHVARCLASEGCEVVALVRPGSVAAQRLTAFVPHLELVKCDLGDRSMVSSVVSRIRPDSALHLAWYLEHGKYLASRENLDSLSASIGLVETLLTAGCSRIVGVGTCFEYDLTEGFLREEGPVRPTTLYAAAKHSLSQLLEQLAGQRNTSWAWARLFYLYGPHEGESRLVASVIRSLVRGEIARVSAGGQIRDFLHVEDAASALVRLLQSDAQGPVNVASGVPVLVRDVVKTIASACDASDRVEYGAIPYRPTDPMFVCADVGKLKARTGWSPAFDLERGIRQTVAWWREQLGV